ncbi:MAG: hypothetical protein ACHQF2_07415 [Flavobacteriales bacterium]
MIRLKNKKNIFFLFFPAILFSGCLGEAELSTRVLEEASSMGDAFIKKDYEKYANYTLDWAARYMGGKKNIKAGVKKLVESFEKKGKRFSAVHYELIGQVKEKDGKYQCMLSQTTTISGEYADTQDEAIVYAVSEDAENWKFATITFMPKEKLLELSPYLHPDLVNPNWKK